MSNVAHQSLACYKCGQPCARLHHLWDGHDYCRECIEQASPELLAHAEQHDVLEEAIPFTWRTYYFSVWKSLFNMCFGLLGTFFLILGVLFGDLLSTAIALIGIAGLVAVLASAWAWAVSSSWPARAPVVSVKEGKLAFEYDSVEDPDDDEPWAEEPLSECHWYEGRISQMSPFLIPSRNLALVLLLPSEPDDPRKYALAVGHSPATRSRWEAFLTLARVPQRIPWRKPTHWLSRIEPAIMVLLPLLCFFGMFVLVPVVTNVAMWITGDADIASMLGFFVALPCIFSIIALALANFPWSHRRVFVQRVRASTRAGTIIVLFFLTALLIVLPAMKSNDWHVTASTIYALLSLAWAISFGWWLGGLGEYTWEASRPVEGEDSE